MSPDFFAHCSGVDTIAGTTGNDTINTTAANMGAFDTVDGGAGIDTLNIDDTAAGASAIVGTYTGIEKLVIQSAAGLASNALNTTSKFAGLTSVKVSMAKDTTLQTVTAATTTAVEVVNTGSAAVTVVGGGTTGKVTTAAGNILVGQSSSPAASDANAYTSVSAKTATGTVTITDNSGTSGAVGSTLTSVSVTGTVGSTTGATALTGKGITSVSLKDTSGNVTITNATTGGHALSLGVAGVTAGTIADSTATSAAITASATTAAGTGNTFTMTGNSIKSLSVAAAKSVTLTSALTGLETVVVTGAGGLVADLSDDGTSTTAGNLTSVDTTGSTASTSAANGTSANVITISNSTSYAGGAGVDQVTVGASTKAITLGAGNDKLTLTALLGTGGTADAGDGIDTLVLTNTLATGISSSTFNAKLSNFEQLEISAIDNSSGTSGTGTIDLGYLANVNNYVRFNAITAASGHTWGETVNNLANGGTVELAGDITATHASLTIGVANAAYGLSDSLNLKLTSSNAVRAGGSVTANGVESINITTSNTATTPTAYNDTLSLTATAVKTLVVSGNAGLTLTNTSTTLTSVDASGITLGDFSWTTGALAANATITGTAQGSNTIDASSMAAGKSVTISVGAGKAGVANTLKGGAAADTITGGAGNDTITTGGGLDNVTTGGGNDVVVVTAGSGTSTNYVVVSDFASGVTVYDTLKASDATALAAFTGTATGWTIANGFATKVGATVADFYAMAAGLTQAIDGVVGFNNGGNTYLYLMGHDDTIKTDDSFVQLTGVALSKLGATAAADTIVLG